MHDVDVQFLYAMIGRQQMTIERLASIVNRQKQRIAELEQKPEEEESVDTEGV
jgi:predicted transcriptional regulator